MFKVFIVDDEPFIIEGLYDILDWAKLGMEIVGHAENGALALEAMKGTPADILITDISMPVMNGLELIRQVRAFHPELKVIVLSGYNEFDYLKEGMALGIENYLLKPINLEEFQGTLQTVVQKLNATRSELVFNEHSMRILKDNVMYRWLRNQISPKEFRERADLLGTRLDKPFVQVAVIRVEHSFAEVFDSITNQLIQASDVVPFRDMDGDIVLVFNIDDAASGKEYAEWVSDNLRLLLSSHNKLYVSLGSVERIEEGSQSYDNAKRAQEYFMVRQADRILRYEDLVSRQQETRLKDGPIDWDEYEKEVMAKDTEALYVRIERDFTYLQQLKGITPDMLQEMAMEWLIRFKMLLQKITHTEEPELYKGGLSQIRRTSTVAGLIEMIKEAAAMTVGLLDRDVKSPVVQQVLNYIHDSYNQDLSLKVLGSMYNIHPVYLGQLFHKEVDETFTEYINRYRIEKAKELLRTTNLKVQEIARNVGYWETGYFYKQFKKYVGISPTEFKGLI
ncbi:response regulator transcription factor [Paenibacillus bouchesdurhonensis]|uniref:response regulator transcription factor n=1 Tax=Paenibacillus bouchesdurhonensis TaxID=1870990 RepID=UPI000DA5F5E8|nr:response regulator transcription factor [Paenibacillus bouchesdurhonensis]